MSSLLPKKKLVKLNVGGERFITYDTTLKQSKYFKSLLANRSDIQYDQENRIFIDRNGKIFQDIMHYLRDKRVVRNRKEDLLWLREVAVFYQIDSLVSDLNERLTDSNANADKESINASNFLLLSIEELGNMESNTVNSSMTLLSDKYEFITTVKTSTSPGSYAQKLLVRVKKSQ